jgi:hypothetical protein
MFKDEYRQKVDSKQRDSLLRSKIFPSMFNHWNMMPESLTEDEKSRRIKVSIPVSNHYCNLLSQTIGSEEVDHQQLEAV